MATAAAASESPDTECSVCHELFKEPKLLPCAHILCRHCLLSWLAANPEATCPLCRGAIADPTEKSQGQGWEEVVDALPDDVAMAALVESTRVLSQEHVCAGCESAEAVSICLHCGDMLCTGCTRTHGKLSATRQHTVHSLAAMTAQRLAANQFAACCSHGDKPSELYCPTHGAAICHLCASSEHRACPEVTLFEKRVEELRRELSSMSAILKTAEDNLDKAISDLDQQLTDVERRTRRSLAEITEACDRLEKSVKACRNRLEKMALAAQKEEENLLKARKGDLSSRLGRIKSHRRVVGRVKKTSPRSKLERATMIIRIRVEGLDLSTPMSTSCMKTVTVDSQRLDRLEKELTLLGEEKWIFLIQPQEPTWRFANTDNVSLTNGGRTAQRIAGNGVIIFSETSMQDNMLYEIRIDDLKGYSQDFFPCGIIRSSPASCSCLPNTSRHGLENAITFYRTVTQCGWETSYEFDIKSTLQNLQRGTRVGFVRDTDGFAYLYINGQKQDGYVSGVPKTSHVFFELFMTYNKVTALPLCAVKT